MWIWQGRWCNPSSPHEGWCTWESVSPVQVQGPYHSKRFIQADSLQMQGVRCEFMQNAMLPGISLWDGNPCCICVVALIEQIIVLIPVCIHCGSFFIFFLEMSRVICSRLNLIGGCIMTAINTSQVLEHLIARSAPGVNCSKECRVWRKRALKNVGGWN